VDPSYMLPVWFCLFCLAGLLFVRFAASRVSILARLTIGLHLLVLTTGAHIFLHSFLGMLHADALSWVRITMLFLAIYIGLRLLDYWLFEIAVPRRRDKTVPLLLRDIVRWVLTLLALLAVVRAIFPQVNLNVLAVSSIVVGYVLGNASQDTLGNLISGLAMNTESPFAIGDWVQAGGHTGQVVDMSWRATCLRTKMDDHIIIPNAAISRDAIINYSRPTGVHGCTLDIGVNYGVPPNHVRRVLLEAAAAVSEMLTSPAPRVWLIAYSDFSIDYRIKFFIREFARLEDIQSDFMDRVWYFFKRENIVIPFPIRDVNLHHVSAADEDQKRAHDAAQRRTVLDRVDLFAPLSEPEKEQLAHELEELVFGAGETLVRQADEGHSFYIVMSGQVRVSVAQGRHHTVLKTLGPGDFFGEMSLLTGEKRSATVTAETDTTVLVLSYRALSSILAAHVKLADDLAAMLVRRQQEQADAAHAVGPTLPSGPALSQTVLFSRICRFFHLDL
jgi:small-conductance mechanosensitive channel